MHSAGEGLRALLTKSRHFSVAASSANVRKPLVKQHCVVLTDACEMHSDVFVDPPSSPAGCYDSPVFEQPCGGTLPGQTDDCEMRSDVFFDPLSTLAGCYDSAMFEQQLPTSVGNPLLQQLAVQNCYFDPLSTLAGC